jgi:transcriptional regulator with PAS, ATPase and Fis domain
MYSHSVALTARDSLLLRDLETTLLQKTNLPSFFCPLDGIREYLGPNTNGTLVCAAASPADVSQIHQLVRDIQLNGWPLAVIVLEAGAVAEQGGLSALDPYVLGRLTWPAQAAALPGLILRAERERRGKTQPFVDKKTLSLTDLLTQELQRQTPSLVEMVEPLVLAASHDVTVLIVGETGTGKTHLAGLIHQNSSRKDHRLMVIPCGALAANLIESELFGHVKGAFTGADRLKVGKFEAVGKGTLLLDEIDTLGLEQQAKLLRVIETGAYEPVGGNDTNMCHGRIIAASNWNVEEAVAQGKFRQDLYYRLNVLAFHLPPLRERIQDIGPLARGMVGQFSQKYHKELFTVSADAIRTLEAFPWPGNIRQMENVVQQAVLVSTGPELLKDHLPKPVREYAAPVPVNRPVPVTGPLAECRDHHERGAIERALIEHKNCRTRAANALGISRVTLYNKMKKYGIKRVAVA